MMEKSDEKRVAIVTGGGRKRLGSFVVDALAERGYSLTVHYLSAATETEAAVAAMNASGKTAIAVRADLSDEQAVAGLVEQTLDRFGRVDALVNCAAIWERKPLEQTTAADVRRHFEINALGTFLCCQHVGLAMVRQDEGGSIVTFGDWAEARPYRNYSAYFASKGAIVGITRSLAVELASRNPRVRVNCILPGPVLLPADLPEADRRRAIYGTLVKREGRPANIVQAVLHFIDNDFVTGACLPVDGGRTLFSDDE
ncbi:MAG TPA: SDR family oxidoreductase [Pirellulales bacterium]|jgi:pteridine reductase|nr:SDR family oxidoreductase [Pirellulales bacterium]